MAGERTEVTEIGTALGMLRPTLEEALALRPSELRNVDDSTWQRLLASSEVSNLQAPLHAAFENGQAFLQSPEALRLRPPAIVEWKGAHRPPGDEVIPADLRIDHVYLVSCKYMSKITLNSSPTRLFDHLLLQNGVRNLNWFAECALSEFQDFYTAALQCGDTTLTDLPEDVRLLTRPQQRLLKQAHSSRTLHDAAKEPWRRLCTAVSFESARRWTEQLQNQKSQLMLLWRMLRISAATYFMLGSDNNDSLRLRIDSNWDWSQRYELERFTVEPASVGQPQVNWVAHVHDREAQAAVAIEGHVEIRWSHGRFVGVPEAKVYLDTPLDQVPGYHRI